MRITLNDPRSVAAVCMLPGQDQFYNWTSGAWEQPFDKAKHIRPLAPVEPAPSVFSTVKTADVSTPLLDRPDAVMAVVNLDASGAPIATIDVWTLPSPIPYPSTGGFSR